MHSVVWIGLFPKQENAEYMLSLICMAPQAHKTVAIIQVLMVAATKKLHQSFSLEQMRKKINNNIIHYGNRLQTTTKEIQLLPDMICSMNHSVRTDTTLAFQTTTFTCCFTKFMTRHIKQFEK